MAPELARFATFAQYIIEDHDGTVDNNDGVGKSLHNYTGGCLSVVLCELLRM